MDCVVQMPSHLFASLYRAAKREASKQVFSLQREYIGMSSQKLESLLQTYTFFLWPVKHQDPPSIPARHPDLPCQGYVPSSFCLSAFVLFLPTPTMYTHTIRPSTYTYTYTYLSTVPHHLFSTILAVEQYFFKADLSIFSFFVLIQIRGF